MKVQRGFVALLMMVLVAVGVFGAMAAWVASEPPRSKQSINREVLAQAREALLAYVAVSGDPANVLTQKTRLPCPDSDGDGDANTAADASHCGVRGQTALGLLPWKTLGLPPLRDADGECLWYAVSGDFKDAESAGVAIGINADTSGMITVANEARQNLAAQLVAVVFAPGAKRASQRRTDPTNFSADKPCVTPTSVAATDAAAYLDPGNAQTSTVPGDAITFVQLAEAADKQSQHNDQLAWITSADYATSAMPRNVKTLQAAFASAVQVSAAEGRLPFASDIPGGSCKQGWYSGFLPVSCSYSYFDTASRTQVTKTFTLADPDGWSKLAFYAVSPRCDSAGCAAALRLPNNRTSKAVLMIRGRRLANQTCPLTSGTESLSDLKKWLPCIENQVNRDALSNPTMASPERVFVEPDKQPASNDILKELP